jgi:class 3 adenylate cyclase
MQSRRPPSGHARALIGGPAEWGVVTLSVLAALAFAALTELLHWSFGAPLDFLILDTLGGITFVAAGAIAWRRRSDVRTGPLLTLSGILWFAGGYQLMPLDPPIPQLGFAIAGLYDVPLAYLLLTFPAERLVGVRRVAVGAVAVGWLGRAAGRLLWGPHPLAPFASRPAFESVESAANWLIVVGAMFVAAVALRRWAQALPFMRRIGWPILAAGVLAMGITAFDASEFASGPILPEFEEPFATVVGWAPFIARALIPFGYLISTLRLRGRRLPVAEVALEAGGTSAVALERALSAALGDPELTVLRWSAAAGEYLNGEGRAITVPGPDDPARAVTYIDDDGRPYAAVIHDALLVEERSIVATLRSAARQALVGEDLRAAVGNRSNAGNLPRGDVTLLFSDIEGSTAHLQRLGLRYTDVLEQHRSIIRKAIGEQGGTEVESVGDEFFAAFVSPSAAARAAVAIQRGLRSHPWTGGTPITVRIGLHRGSPTLTPGGYVGLDVHRASRIMSAANGGQILASDAVAAAVLNDPSSHMVVRPLGPHAFRGLAEPIDVALIEMADEVQPTVPIRAQLAAPGPSDRGATPNQ